VYCPCVEGSRKKRPRLKRKGTSCNERSGLRTVPWRGASRPASGATGGRPEVLRYEGEGWQLLAARGWRAFCFCLSRKKHDSPEAGGDQQASFTWQRLAVAVMARNEPWQTQTRELQ
jgi:hypothetical protein